MCRLFLLLALSLAISFSTAAAEMHLGDDGLDIDAGSLGKFTLTYPQLRNASQRSYCGNFGAGRLGGVTGASTI
ncbi:hypothetical protein CfE428DRAFT_1510 [Chthoniobacter flavus Ellin428]|uniref:Uncharacterized protein n=1 Tax=Chthoniobacter flavus Ellin428 TaxID=497964 RepID=B4CY69_9BACT|nr:hypothetical protein [Chthoniobacter flavus]EDY21217.1 hypothetical protein CfE428DRAFT_1510 [Chthoniobacter flavus Ellin428]TCO87586.1 hypothetical protein EV701_12188 [Chthoniobacter flavus]